MNSFARSQTPFGNALVGNSVSSRESARETEFRGPAFPNGVWERANEVSASGKMQLADGQLRRAVRRLSLAERVGLRKEGNPSRPQRRPIMPALSLIEVLAEVPDPRSRHGRIHPLPAILALTVLAMLRGCKGPVAIAQFGRDYGTPLAHALGFTRGKTPAASCLCELFSRLDAVAFEAALSRWIAARTPPAGGDT